jgi:translation initiation factor 2 subunit 3
MTRSDIEKSQPVLNIGLVGHVDHGKTTLTEALSGKWTDTHSEEMRRGITIKLGYANTVIRKIPGKTGHEAYTVEKKVDGKETESIKKISFVDAPGHESLMATMLSGATIMDGAMLLISAAEECPQPQTREHLMALEIMGIKKLIVIQNKIDLVKPEQAKNNYNQIKEFLKGTAFADAPIIPISAQHRINIDMLLEAIDTIFEVPKRDPSIDPIMFVARSFDINKPGVLPKELKGGVVGGSLQQGIIKVGDEIEIKPGRRVEEQNQIVYKPITTTVTSIFSGADQIKEAHPGGSVALSTTLDPGVVKSDLLIGSLIGHKGKLPDVLHELKLDINLLDRVVGSKTDLKVENIRAGETLMLNVNASSTVGQVVRADKKSAQMKLKLPVCAEQGARVTISRIVGSRFRLIGFGIIQ